MTATAVETVEPLGVGTVLPPGIEGGDEPAPIQPAPWNLPPLKPEEFRSLFPATPDKSKVSGKRGLVVSKALNFLGTPYVWGGAGPNGFDCSGLLQYSFGQYGIDIPRVSFQQANAGARIPLSDLKPGDLVAWDNSARNNGADHIAMYVGNGWIVEAPRPGLAVRKRKLNPDDGAFGVSMAAFFGED